MHSKGVLAFTAFALIASQATAARQSGQDSAKNRGQAQEKTYCFQFAQDTGSRISRTECRTKKQWSLLGVEVDELLEK